MLKFVLAALVLPASLLLASQLYDGQQSKRIAAEKRHSEVAESVPAIRAATARLYEPCLGTDESVCQERLSDAYGSFITAIATIRTVAARYFPELVPTVLLLSSLTSQVAFETDFIWSEFFFCLDKGEEGRQECVDTRRSYPIWALQSAQFLVEFLECKIQALTALETQDSESPYCSAVIQRRENLALREPAHAMTFYTGDRPPEEFERILNSIFCEHLLAGSGLDDPRCD